MKLLVALASIALVAARCPNDCSGRGVCNAGSVCECQRNFAGADCSKRICYHGLAFIDSPLGDINANNAIDVKQQIYFSESNSPVGEMYPVEYGLARDSNTKAWDEAHFYRECSNKGTCDTATGVCNCFPGFEGEGCTRTVCPNNCGGHGQCTLIDVALKVEKKQEYHAWDAQKTQGCKCDPGYDGPSCSLRKCVKGVDPIYNVYTNTDSVYKISLKKKAKSSSNPQNVPNGPFHFTLTYKDDMGDEWTTTAVTAYYNEGVPSFFNGKVNSSPNLREVSFGQDFLAEQVNASLQALPNSIIRDSYVWVVSANTSKPHIIYPYAILPASKAATYYTAMSTNAGIKVPSGHPGPALGKSKYVNDAKYRFPFWAAHKTKGNSATIADALNCAADDVCIFIRLNNPVGEKALTINYKFSADSANGELEEKKGSATHAMQGAKTDTGLGIVAVDEVGRDRIHNEGLDGTPLIAFRSDQTLHECSKRGLCDYTTGTCSCFDGYSGYNCAQRSALGM